MPLAPPTIRIVVWSMHRDLAALTPSPGADFIHQPTRQLEPCRRLLPPLPFLSSGNNSGCCDWSRSARVWQDFLLISTVNTCMLGVLILRLHQPRHSCVSDTFMQGNLVVPYLFAKMVLKTTPSSHWHASFPFLVV